MKEAVIKSGVGKTVAYEIQTIMKNRRFSAAELLFATGKEACKKTISNCYSTMFVEWIFLLYLRKKKATCAALDVFTTE